MPIKRC